MNRTTPLLTLAAVSTLALAACQDNAPTELRPTAAPLAAKGGNGNGNGNNGALLPGLSSTRGVTPTPYAGNARPEDDATCTSLGLSGEFNVDGATSQQIAGYQFTVSGDDQSVLSFAPAGSAAPATAITAVIVKGGPAYDVYRFSVTGPTSDGNLTAPYNRGGNIPGVSHYIVCTAPAVRVMKKLVGVMTSDGRGGMTADGSWSSGNPVVIPQGETRWLQFQIDYQQAPGASGTLTENGAAVCATLGSGFGCTSAGFGSSNVSGSGSTTIMIDVKNNGCNSGTLTNTVTFASGGVSTSASAAVVIQALCVQKRLLQVMTSNGSGGMTTDPTYQDGKVTIPKGQTRWLEYEISYTVPAGLSATLADNVAAACNTLSSAGPGFTCSTAGFEGFGGQSLTVTGVGTRRIIIDITNGTGCGDRTFTNTAVLSRAVGSSTSATSDVMIWTPACTP